MLKKQERVGWVERSETHPTGREMRSVDGIQETMWRDSVGIDRGFIDFDRVGRFGHSLCRRHDRQGIVRRYGRDDGERQAGDYG